MTSAVLVDGVVFKSFLTVLVVDRTLFTIYNVYTYSYASSFMHNLDGPSAISVLCSKHFEPECFVVGGIHYHDSMGIPAKHWLKPGAIPTKFARSTHGEVSLAFHVKGHPLKSVKDKW